MRSSQTQADGWKTGVILDLLVPVLIGAAILAIVILMFAASSPHGAD